MLFRWFSLGLWLWLCSCGWQTLGSTFLWCIGNRNCCLRRRPSWLQIQCCLGTFLALIFTGLYDCSLNFPYCDHSQLITPDRGVPDAISMALEKLACFHRTMQPCKPGGRSRLAALRDEVQNLLSFMHESPVLLPSTHLAATEATPAG